MQDSTEDDVKQLLGTTLGCFAFQAQASIDSAWRILLSQRRLPERGWSLLMIRTVLQQLAMLDSNNLNNVIAVGEREGRCVSPLVHDRYYGLCHGVGRSGDLLEKQPKAAGSTLIQVVTHYLVKDCLRSIGLQELQHSVLLPFATGMALVFCLLHLNGISTTSSTRVLWSRIDQKSCFKCITAAGLVAEVVELVADGNGLTTDVEAFRQALSQSPTLCVMATTSCFAPRMPDDLTSLAKLCCQHGVPLLVNNAYGLQDASCRKLLRAAANIMKGGPPFLVVQSTDKNFRVPVGGSLVCSPDHSIIQALAGAYPGRASANHIIDMFITLLEQGRKGIVDAYELREEVYLQAKRLISNYALRSEGRLQLMDTPKNTISFAVALQFDIDRRGHDCCEAYSSLGSQLFYRRVSGARFVVPEQAVCNNPAAHQKLIGDHLFTNFGSHSNNQRLPYFTLAACVGSVSEDFRKFISASEPIFAVKNGGAVQPD